MTANALACKLKPVARRLISARRSSSFPVLAGPLKGQRIPASVAAQSLGMLAGRYEPGVVKKFLSLAGSIKAAYDIGAHVGYISLALCHCARAERVYAFEPVPTNADLVREMAYENHLNSRITLVRKAVSDDIRTQPMHSWQSSSMFFLEGARAEQVVDTAKTITVEVCTIDSFVFDCANRPPDFLKIDVEGAEELVLRGALRTLSTFYPRILLEAHGPKNAEKTWARLEPLQYQWRHLDEAGKERPIRREDLSRLFSKEVWTAHFFLSKG
jgi:FkbM family methyltransferase